MIIQIENLKITCSPGKRGEYRVRGHYMKRELRVLLMQAFEEGLQLRFRDKRKTRWTTWTKAWVRGIAEDYSAQSGYTFTFDLLIDRHRPVAYGTSYIRQSNRGRTPHTVAQVQRQERLQL